MAVDGEQSADILIAFLGISIIIWEKSNFFLIIHLFIILFHFGVIFFLMKNAEE